MANTFVFLPAPRRVDWLEGTFDVAGHTTILLDPKHPQALRFAAQRYRDFLASTHEVCGELIATSAAPGDDIGLTLLVMPEAVQMPEGSGFASHRVVSRSTVMTLPVSSTGSVP